MDGETSRDEQDQLSDLGRSIALRAGILTLAGVIVGGWVASLALKTAGKLVRVLVGLILLLVAGTFISVEVNRARDHFQGSER